MGPYYWLIGSLMDEGDDFCQRLRKSIIAINFFPCSFLCLFSAINMGVAPDGAEGAARWAIVTSLCCQIMVFWCLYFAVRRTRHVSPLQAAVLPWVIALGAQPSAWYNPATDCKLVWVCLSMMAVLLQVPRVYFFLAFTFVLTLFGDWNTIHLEEPEMMLQPPGTFRRSSTNRYTVAVLLSLLIGVMIYNFIKQIAESERRGAALKAANEMTLEILKYQRKYETDAIDDVLNNCKEAGVVEAELIEIYETMNVNMKSYRPFLPNYLFQETEEDEEEGENKYDGEEGASVGISENSTNVRRSRGSREGSAMAALQNSAIMSESATASHSRNDNSSIKNRLSRVSSDGYTGRYATTNLNKRGHLFEGRITFALVDIHADRLASGVDIHQNSSSASILRTITQMVYQLAKETKASVHSMLGDTVQLTWNATSSVALPETKGAVFLTRLAKLLRDHSSSPITLSAAVCSGSATVHNITTDNQQALIIGAPWLPALEGCFDLAKQVSSATVSANGGYATSCVLMDNRTMKASALEIHSCPVEQVSYAENGKPSFVGVYQDVRMTPPTCDDDNDVKAATMVHQILSEHIRADGEWMYQLQKSGADDSDQAVQAALQLQAILCVAEGKFSERSAVLEEHRRLFAGNTGNEFGKRVANPEFARALDRRCAEATMRQTEISSQAVS